MMNQATAAAVILCDTREPTSPEHVHPYAKHLPGIIFQRRGLNVGDIAAAWNPLVAIERKTLGDFLSTITSGRERFNAELRRARGLDRFFILVEASLTDCLCRRGGISEAAILGTVAAFQRRGFPILFAGSERLAALLAHKILTGPLTEANKLVKDAAKLVEIDRDLAA